MRALPGICAGGLKRSVTRWIQASARRPICAGSRSIKGSEKRSRVCALNVLSDAPTYNACRPERSPASSQAAHSRAWKPWAGLLPRTAWMWLDTSVQSRRFSRIPTGESPGEGGKVPKAAGG